MNSLKKWMELIKLNKQTIKEFNNSDINTTFDPTILDGKSTKGLDIKNQIDEGPFKAFPVTGGITFTYGGLKLMSKVQFLILMMNQYGLYACGISRWSFF